MKLVPLMVLALFLAGCTCNCPVTVEEPEAIVEATPTPAIEENDIITMGGLWWSKHDDMCYREGDIELEEPCPI